MESFWSSNVVTLAAWILGTSVAAISGAVTAQAAQQFYGQLSKPKWAPPPWLFGPAWSVLYVTMAIAAWRVWHAYGFSGAQKELTLYFVQLAFNAAWSWFFFVRRSGALATLEVAGLWTAVVATTVAFGLRDPIAGALFVPYALWVSFASALTVSVWRRNPTLL